ncbi:phytoene synthase [Defluviimonas sp. 20V17]|uniref:Phytoene synthase n=1 Tax=Allgaiera indica TaxID=765699 RepID=A0AAN4UPC4_9RHOB|nr:squalene/phytoene synthase family protein [Allgaiera indica]KDB03735.1 phytoene synthase [Defluviimonas sp. 20V17]GHD99800.1 phytoene synthase [Allgaiera indica]SDW43589.1 Squalene/phytoene synthase [Allgaiera indica]
MSLEACAALVERGDPERFVTARGPAAARLMPLYAFNLEIARAPWVTAEPLIAEMRLTWWDEALEEIAAGRPPRAHEVVIPLAGVIRDAALPMGPFHEMIAARRWDVAAQPFADEAALWAHLEASAGNLMWLAARALGAPEAARDVVRDFGTGAGLAAWLRAVPALVARGRAPLPEGVDPAALARAGLGRIARARGGRRMVPAAALPAMLAGAGAGSMLRRVLRDPDAVARDGLDRSEFARRSGLLARAISGRW